MRHCDKNHRNSSHNHNIPQHLKPKPDYPNRPAPGGGNAEPKKSFLQNFKSKFQKPPEPPATKEQVEQMKYNAERAKYGFTEKFYKQKEKDLKKGHGFSALFSNTSPPPSRGGGGGRGRRTATETGMDIFGSGGGSSFFSSESGGNGVMDLFTDNQRPQPKGRRSGPPPRSGVEDMFT